jgi:hypothetical protein
MIKQHYTLSSHFLTGRCLALALLGIVSLTTGGTADAQTSLYERLGGLKGITVVVDDFIDSLVVNEDKCRTQELASALFEISSLAARLRGGWRAMQIYRRRHEALPCPPEHQ